MEKTIRSLLRASICHRARHLSNSHSCRMTHEMLTCAAYRSSFILSAATHLGCLSSVTKRRFSTVVTATSNHTFSDEDDMVDWLANNIIYEDDLIIAVNKLSGTSVMGIQQPSETYSTSEITQPVKIDLSIASVLQLLKRRLNCPSLEVAFGNPKHHSGVVILAKSLKAKERVEKCVNAAQVQKRTHLTYLAVTHGIPTSVKEGTEEMGFTRKRFDKRLLAVRVYKQNKSARQRGDEIWSAFDTNVLEVNDDLEVSLVKICASKTKWDVVELYATEKLCSILGDHQYSHRLTKVLGVVQRVRPHVAPSTNTAQVLPKSLRRQLGILLDDVSSLPLHLHRHEVELVGFPNKKSSVVLTAPLPYYFKHTLERLNLSVLNQSLDT